MTEQAATAQDPTKTAQPGAQAQPPAVNPETHDPVTGKSWRDIALENRARADALANQPPQPTAPPQPATTGLSADQRQRLEERFSNDPIGTLIDVASQAGRYHVNRALNETREARKRVRSIKRKLRERYPDYSDHASAFDTRLEELDVMSLSEEDLELNFQAIRSRGLEKKLNERDKAAAAPPAAGTPTSEEGRPPGSPSPSAGAGTSAAPVTGSDEPLTSAQEKEFAQMGSLSPEGYRRALKNRQDNARRMGCTVLPQTLSEPLKRPAPAAQV